MWAAVHQSSGTTHGVTTPAFLRLHSIHSVAAHQSTISKDSLQKTGGDTATSRLTTICSHSEPVAPSLRRGVSNPH